MNQVWKFYLSSFLKNQTYFTPILIVFLQAQSLDFQQIFWVFTIGSTASFLLEIPTGVFADLYGKRKSIMLSKFLIFASFMTFGFSHSFWWFVLAQVLYEIGQAFRTGTETAYVYDYLDEKQTSYTEVKGKQKFYARLGESLATAAGGLIAASLGFSWVFFIAAIPAFMNFLNVWSWEHLKTDGGRKVSMHSSLDLTKNSLQKLLKETKLWRIVLNITLFTAVIAAMDKFIQPYMQNAGIGIEVFGFIYSAALLLSAFLVRYAHVLERVFGALRTVNTLTLVAVLPLVVLGSGFVNAWGVLLFFFVIVVENIRSPVANNLFQGEVSSSERATMGSLLSQSKSLGKMALLPLAGFLTNSFSMSIALWVLAGILIVNAVLFRFKA